MTHTITVTEEQFKAYQSAKRTFILLKDDKNYTFGDTLIFQVFPEREELKMEVVDVEVDTAGLKQKHVILGIQPKQ